MIEISVVIPLLNEVESIRELYGNLLSVLEPLDKSFEIIFVDDGSTDGSLEVLKALNTADIRVKVLSFRRNFGKSAAYMTAFKKSDGKVVITLDADLQDDPVEIPRLLDKVRDDFDLVCGWRKKRNDPLSKRISSNLFNLGVAKLSRVPLHDFNCGFKAYKKEVVKGLNLRGDLYRFIPVFVSWQGYKVTEIPITHYKRKYGQTKYGFKRGFVSILDFLGVLFVTKFAQSPIRFFGFQGFVLLITGLFINLYLAFGWYKGMVLSNRPLLFLGILLMLLGVNLLSLGLIGEMLLQINNKKIYYTVKEELG